MTTTAGRRPALRLIAVLTVLATLIGGLLLAAPSGAAPTTTDRARPHVRAHWSARTAPLGAQVVVKGTLPTRGKARVLLQQRVGRHGWRTVKAKKTHRKHFRLTVPTHHRGRFGYSVLVRSGHRALRSKTHPLHVVRRRTVARVAWPTSAVTGTAAAVTGTLSPAATRKVTLQRHMPSGWVTIGRAKSAGTGAFSVPVPTRYLGSWTMRLSVKQTARASKVRVKEGATFTVAPSYAPPGSPTSYRLFDDVARWNPCGGPIGVRVNFSKAPASATVADVERALYRLDQATGLDFVYRGTTGKVPQGNYRQWFGKDTRVVIAWTPESGSAMFPPHATQNGIDAYGGQVAVRRGRDRHGRLVREVVRGGVVINTAANGRYASGDGTGPTWTELIMHEMGHVVGLNHTSDKTQIMYPTLDPKRPVYGAGDLAGLQRMGFLQGCIRFRR